MLRTLSTLSALSTLLVPRARRSPENTPRPQAPGPRTAIGTGTGTGTGRTASAAGPLAVTRLPVPADLPATLGCDAVGVPARYGFRTLSRLPAKGCVYADGDWWWWLVPAGSDLDLVWPLPACYAPGAVIPDRGPRLIHHPDGGSPYTPPIPLYLLICQLTGTAPAWSGPPRLRTAR